MGTATFSGNGSYYIDVDAALVSQNKGGNFSTIYWRVQVVKTAGYGFWASTGVGNKGWADSSQGGDRDLWNAGDLSYDFRNGSTTGRWTMAEGQFNVPHRSDGNAEYYVNGGLTLANLGSASAGTGWRSLPRIVNSTVPNAPVGTGFGTIDQTSIQYKFTGNGDGGTPVREWQAMYNDATINGPQITYGSDGATPVGGLKPGHTYNFWSRGRNDVGWGPWSGMSTTKTIAGARVKVNGTWRDAVPYVKVNGVWRLARPLVKVNGNWKKCG